MHVGATVALTVDIPAMNFCLSAGSYFIDGFVYYRILQKTALERNA